MTEYKATRCVALYSPPFEYPPNIPLPFHIQTIEHAPNHKKNRANSLKTIPEYKATHCVAL